MNFREFCSNACLNIYLRRATFGLPKELAEEVWNELEEHALNRALQYELQGMSPPQALQSAMTDLGPPLNVAAQMNKVHNMFKILGLGLIVTLAFSTSFYVLANQPPTYLPILEEIPVSEVCINSSKKPHPNAQILSKSDGKICFQYKDLSTYQGAFIEASILEKFTNQQGGEMVEIGNDLFFHMADGSLIYSQHVFRKDGKRYIPISSLFNPWHNRKLTIQSYVPLIISLDGLNITVGKKNSIASEVFFDDLTPNFANSVLKCIKEKQQFNCHKKSIKLETQRPNQFQHSIKTKLQAGQAVMIFTHAPQGGYNAFVNPISSKGILKIPSYHKHLQLTTDTLKFTQKSIHPETALILSVTNMNTQNKDFLEDDYSRGHIIDSTYDH